MAKTSESVTAEIQALRKRIESQYPAAGQVAGEASRQSGGYEPGSASKDATEANLPDPLPLADLLPLFHARDAAEGKVAAIGKVNPRPGGALNALIQAAKRSIARSLQWFVRDQVDFNYATVSALSEAMEALNELNRSLVVASSRLAQLEQRAGEQQQLSAELDSVRAEADERLREATDNLSTQTRDAEATLRQLLTAQQEGMQRQLASLQESQRQGWEKTAASVAELGTRADLAARQREREDIRLLRTLADVQNAFMQRLSLAEDEWKTLVETRVAQAEQRGQAAIQAAVAESRTRLDTVLHDELRLLRQRVGAILAQPEEAASEDVRQRHAVEAARAMVPAPGYLDDVRFADRFRGSVDSVKDKLGVHLSAFQDHGPVLDLGCGRGEFLALLHQEGVEAIGVDSNPELVRVVRAQGLRAIEDDLFRFLEKQPADSAGGIFCAHVIEHLPPEALIRLVADALRVLRPGGRLVLETPNPGCLAIFATYFYLDPTHLRPVPAEFLEYLLEEKGFVEVSVNFLHPAEESFPSLKPLDGPFRQQFFGCLDYAIRAQKPATAGSVERP